MLANQLLEKILSSTSEDEAIACLRMVRKKGLKLATLSTRSQYERDLEDKLYKHYFFPPSYTSQYNKKDQ